MALRFPNNSTLPRSVAPSGGTRHQPGGVPIIPFNNGSVSLVSKRTSTNPHVVGSGVRLTAVEGRCDVLYDPSGLVFYRVLNEGSESFDADRGEFTAPADGTYQFLYSVSVSNCSRRGHVVATVELMVDDVPAVASSGTALVSPNQDNAYPLHMSDSALLRLTAGQVVSVAVRQNTHYDFICAQGRLTVVSV